MEELFISPYILALIFLFVSTAYSSVGLGGGSSYTALLAIFGASYRVIPTVSLTLNCLVTLMASINYIRQGHARPKLIAAFVITSVPMAYLGGSLDVEQRFFHSLLLIMLVLVAARIYFWRKPALKQRFEGHSKILVSLLVGAILGFVSGIVGIGGGIFLVPLIIILGLGDQKEAAAAGAIFIFLNSIAGLVAHLQRQLPDLASMAPLIVAVILGGYLGSYLGSARFDHGLVQRILGTIIVVAIVLLSVRLF